MTGISIPDSREKHVASTLAAQGDPHLRPMERKIQNAGKYSCNCQNSCGEWGE